MIHTGLIWHKFFIVQTWYNILMQELVSVLILMSKSKFYYEMSYPKIVLLGVQFLVHKTVINVINVINYVM